MELVSQPITSPSRVDLRTLTINNYGVAVDNGYKGWAIGSRWATEINDLDPWLVALDPSFGEVVLGDDDFNQLAVKLQREYLRRALIVTGFNSGPFIPTESSTDLAIPFDAVTTYQADRRDELTGLLVAVGRSGFIPIRNAVAASAVPLLVTTLGVWSVLVITEKLLRAVGDGFLLRESEGSGAGNIYLKHGIGLVALRMGEADGSLQARQDG